MRWTVEGVSEVSHPTRTTMALPSTQVAPTSNLASGRIERKTGYTQMNDLSYVSLLRLHGVDGNQVRLHSPARKLDQTQTVRGDNQGRSGQERNMLGLLLVGHVGMSGEHQRHVGMPPQKVQGLRTRFPTPAERHKRSWPTPWTTG